MGRGPIIIGVLVAAVVAAVVIARPERVPGGLVPPPRSAVAQSPIVPTNEPTEAANDDPQEEQPQKGYSLTRMDLEQGMEKVRAQAIACRDESTPPVVQVRLVIAPTGSVTSVILPQDVKGTRAGDCIARALRQASFPTWAPQPNVAEVEWDYPLGAE